jgi:hypothetical protein
MLCIVKKQPMHDFKIAAVLIEQEPCDCGFLLVSAARRRPQKRPQQRETQKASQRLSISLRR